MTTLIHARSLVFVGFSGGDSVNSGRRTYQERKLRDGQVELVCGLGLDDVHKAAVAAHPGEPGAHYPWATLKSKKSREAKFVTCPECVRRMRAAGFLRVSAARPEAQDNA